MEAEFKYFRRRKRKYLSRSWLEKIHCIGMLRFAAIRSTTAIETCMGVYRYQAGGPAKVLGNRFKKIPSYDCRARTDVVMKWSMVCKERTPLGPREGGQVSATYANGVVVYEVPVANAQHRITNAGLKRFNFENCEKPASDLPSTIFAARLRADCFAGFAYPGSGENH